MNREVWPSRSRVLCYIVEQKKPSLVNVGKKNLQICQLEIGELIGGKIPIWQIIEVYVGGLLE